MREPYSPIEKASREKTYPPLPHAVVETQISRVDLARKVNGHAKVAKEYQNGCVEAEIMDRKRKTSLAIAQRIRRSLLLIPAAME